MRGPFRRGNKVLPPPDNKYIYASDIFPSRFGWDSRLALFLQRGARRAVLVQITRDGVQREGGAARQPGATRLRAGRTGEKAYSSQAAAQL